MELKMEYNLDEEKNKPCWLMKHGCPCRTGSCHYGLPDNGCPVYRWFKQVIEWNKLNNPDLA